ncbi:MAG: DNA helicase UvrD, partial [Candidatus Bathyarchaeia archaeon]
ADRPRGFQPNNRPGFISTLPLHEIIATVLGVETPANAKVWSTYNSLVERFGNEYTVLLDADLEEMAKVAGVPIARSIMNVRHGAVEVDPGYDGVYGRIRLNKQPRVS